MSGLIEEITSQEQAIEYARQDPNKAIGVLIWNYLQSEQKHRSDLKKNRLKNIACQTGGGVFGGAVAVWCYLHLHMTELVAAVRESIKVQP
ncbi:MAG: hypothetical protein M0Z43_02165 [Acidithiobacillus sp.]|nr:hypothetical protein [Acidithiobacillus sp.]